MEMHCDVIFSQPLALVSWGCIYRMEWVESHFVRAWLEQNALKTDESLDYSIGTYSKGDITSLCRTHACT